MKKKRSVILVLKKSVLYSVAAGLMLLLAVCSKETIPAAKDSLRLCAENIIPSLFPFFVLAQMLIKTGFTRTIGRFLSPLMKTLFKVSGTGGVAFAIGIISGYPMGAKTVCDLYKSGDLSKSEAERLLPYCNNSGPLFIIGAVGAGMLGSSDAGMFLYVIHIIAAVATGLVMRFFCKDEIRGDGRSYMIAEGQKTVGAVFSESVREAVSSILAVCGFVVFFAAVSAPFLRFVGDNVIGSIFKGVLEVTGGVKSTAENCDFAVGMPVIAGLLGFGGICVALQVMGIVKEAHLSMKPYIFGKIHQGIISAVLCGVLLQRNTAVTTFKANDAVNFETGNFGAAMTAVFIICAFYFFILALRKNFKKY